MMALPFAMADELEAQSDAVENVVESNEVAIGDEAVGAESNDESNVEGLREVPTLDSIIQYANELGLELDSDDKILMDKKNMKFSVSLGVFFPMARKYRHVSVNSTNPKVAKISKKSNGMVQITLKGSGETTLSAKYDWKDDNDNWHEDEEDPDVTIEVKDIIPKEVVAFYGDPDDWDEAGDDDFEDVTKKAYGTKKPDDIDTYGAQEDVLIPFVANAAGEMIADDYMTEDDVKTATLDEYAQIERSVFKWSWSKPKSVCFAKVDEKGELEFLKSGEDLNGDFTNYVVYAREPGKSKLTLTHKKSKKKTTLTFNVNAKKINKYTGKEAYKKDNQVSVVVKGAEWIKYNKLKVTFSIYNGSGKDLAAKRVHGVKLDVELDNESKAVLPTELSGTMKVDKKIKSHKYGTATMEIPLAAFDLRDVDIMKADVDPDDEDDPLVKWVGDLDIRGNSED
jgi:hypothetical protein